MRPHRDIARRPLSATRLAATLLALLFTVGQLGGYLHLALVRHGRCAEHGELIDLGDAHGGGQRTALLQPRPRLAILGQGGAAHGDEHRHDHCAAAPERRHQGTAPGSQRLLSATLTLLPAALPQRQPAPCPAEARYRLAPKTSPPA